jgi:hypothetical protein
MEGRGELNFKYLAQINNSTTHHGKKKKIRIKKNILGPFFFSKEK